MTKKEMINLYKNTIIGSTHTSNTHGVLIHYIDDEKLLCSMVFNNTTISYHYVKYDENGRFRIGNLIMDLNEFLRVSIYY